MDPPKPTSPPPNSSPKPSPQPSSSSKGTSIAVGTGTPEDEEDPYAAAGLTSPASVAATGQPGSFITAGRDSTSVGDDSSAFAADMRAYPASMTSSIRAHVYEGGLRYHAYRDGKYAFPNDEVEQNRDDMKHTMTLMLCRGRHFYSPIEERLKEGGSCLDLGTGTGIWVIEVADAYPETNITGLDLSPIQPNYVPENVHFFVDDFEEDWVDEGETFDFIHVRHTIHSVRDRPGLLKRIYDHLKPGGYVEFQELYYDAQCDDGSLTPEIPYAFRDFLSYLGQGMQALGTEINAVGDLPDELRAAGFDSVELVTHKCPIGVWPRDKRLRLCGLFMRTVIMDGLRGLSGRPFLNGLHWTPLQIEMFLVDVRKAVMDNKFHTYFPFHIVYGRKPLG